MLEIIAETSLYKEIISRGMQEGIEQGKELGLRDGREEELRKLLSKQLSSRFGSLDDDTRRKLENLSFDKAENLAENIFAIESIEDLQRRLMQAGS